jgi:Predicted membrane protein
LRIAILLGTIAGDHKIIVIALTFVVALVASLARVWGNAGSSVGGPALSTFVIAIAYPAALNAAVGRAGFVVLGGIWGMIVSLILWPLRPYRPARIAVAAAYRELATYIDQVSEEIDHSLLAETRALPAHIPVVRAALENSRQVLARLRQGRPGESARGDQLIVLSEAADQLFGHIVGVAETIEAIPRSQRNPYIEAEAITILRQTAATVRRVASAVEEEDHHVEVDISRTPDLLRERIESAGRETASANDAAIHYLHAATIFSRAAQYVEVGATTASALNGKSNISTNVPPRASDSVVDRTPVRIFARAIVNPGSFLFRYALRVAVVTSAAVAITEGLGIKRGYWMTLTVIVILQPYTGVTSQRAAQRIIGTVLGGVITAALGALIHNPIAITALAFVFVSLCIALLPVNYVAFSIFLTPTFVLLAEASAGDWHLAGTRVVNTILGGILAWVGSRILWPSPEADRLPGQMAESLNANLAYLQRVLKYFDDRSESAGRAILDARRATGLTASNTDESFQRYIGEHSGHTEDLSSAMTFTTYMRRLTASIAALSLLRHGSERPPASVLSPFVDAASRELENLSESVITNRRPPRKLDIPALTDAENKAYPLLSARIERLVRQLGTVHDAVDRWTSRI